jgi:nucleolar protein 56
MELYWDWRMARLIDDSGFVVDEAIWDGIRSPGAVADRIEKMKKERMTSEARELADRFPNSITLITAPENWPPLEKEDLALMEQAALILARRGIAQAAGDGDRRLEHLVHSVEELRSAWTTLESRVVEWTGLFLIDVDLDSERKNIPKVVASAENFDTLVEALDLITPEHRPTKKEWTAIKGSAITAVELSNRIDESEIAIRNQVEEYLPSLSQLLGPLLAARLCVAAHGRSRLARLPSSTVQVLGAEKAFFAHLRTGSPPPKHGMIFQHPWISRSPRWVRGKISRLLAGKASIAVRIDEHGGTPWSQKEILSIEKAVESIRSRHPKPPSKKGR